MFPPAPECLISSSGLRAGKQTGRQARVGQIFLELTTSSTWLLSLLLYCLLSRKGRLASVSSLSPARAPSLRSGLPLDSDLRLASGVSGATSTKGLAPPSLNSSTPFLSTFPLSLLSASGHRFFAPSLRSNVSIYSLSLFTFFLVFSSSELNLPLLHLSVSSSLCPVVFRPTAFYHDVSLLRKLSSLSGRYTDFCFSVSQNQLRFWLLLNIFLVRVAVALFPIFRPGSLCCLSFTYLMSHF
ncbi:uncharacterized protein BKA78DRAFT_52468 [Phyllosticta capitalensis]|uniref:Transmembrane protein n=1 Tax=Phyllosticta capitalensis TaxID=121624 RepID=A0ABR1YDJ7_9PEZI